MVGRLTRPELVVVTGAGSGIGRATAEAFAKDGATAICADIDLAAATETVLRISQHGGSAEAYQLDVADPEAFERFAGSVAEAHGVPDVVVNNAGIGMGGPFLEHSVEDLRRIVDVNLLGVAYGCRLFGRQLAERHKTEPKRRGHIVNIASAAAYTPSRALPAYVMTKAAVLMLSEALRAELRDHNVGVSAICPGFIATNIYAATKFAGPGDSAEKGGLIQDVFGRLAPGPELVAQRIRFAVRFDIPVLPVTVGSWLAYGTFHYAMPLMRRLATLDLDSQLPRLDRLTRRLRPAPAEPKPAPDDDPARSPRA
ncbi:SDR family NAD(P)-dependent oxidoreductase [Pseudonocardia eucalypti]|uniref:SDR family NAD(P)-dependent oxidoreductase n=1 Tax=Pseudonocardia eucalypti TaxID=648755 RepID=A0ABP9Q0R5_9PSEU|nr:NAD(P)-dependent dehydrogenase (short-subunit alcohol dehydrogenase family) [Pseudonocardia eucalypti]